MSATRRVAPAGSPRWSVVLLALGLALPTRARGDDALHLAQVLAEAQERNPELRAARDRAKAMASIPAQVSAYDDPMLSYEAWNIPESLRIDRADNNIFKISQKIPFPGKRRLAGEVAAHEAEQTSHAADEVALDIIASVKHSYYELWQAHERLSVFAREKGLLEGFTHVAEQKYAAGATSQADVVRAQVELTHQINMIQTERLAIHTTGAALAALLSRAHDEPLGIPDSPGVPALGQTSAALTRLAMEKRPDIAARRAGIAREEGAIELAERNHLPDFEFSVGRFVNYGMNDGFGASASVTLPFVNHEKYSAGVTEAMLRLSAAKAERRQIDDRVQREVEQAYLRAQTALWQVDLFTNTHVPQIEQALRVTEAGYQTGSVGFLDLIDTLRRLEEIHLDDIGARTEFEIAYADLERAVGEDLPRQQKQRPSRRIEHD